MRESIPGEKVFSRTCLTSMAAEGSSSGQAGREMGERGRVVFYPCGDALKAADSNKTKRIKDFGKGIKGRVFSPGGKGKVAQGLESRKERPVD
jgi:hypothetical protein